MKRLSVALLAIGLVSSSAVFAQSAYSPSNDGYDDRYDNSYRDDYQRDEYQRDGNQQGEAYYDYARVIRVDPVLASYRGTSNYGNQRCYETRSAGTYQRDGYYGDRNQYGNGAYGNSAYGNNGYYRDAYGRSQYGGGTTAGRNVATVVGGIAGAVLGSKIGGGSGTYAATAIGSMVGGMAGRQVYENTQRDRYTPGGTVRVCEPEPVGNGYYSRTNDGRGSAYDVTYEYNGRRYTRRMDYHPGDRVRVRVDVSPQ